MNNEWIYVVVGVSGIVFIATTNYEKAKEVHRHFQRSTLQHWENDKCVLVDEVCYP